MIHTRGSHVPVYHYTKWLSANSFVLYTFQCDKQIENERFINYKKQKLIFPL